MRRRGRPRKSWKDSIKEWTCLSTPSLLCVADDRRRWAAITAEASVGVPQRRLGVTGFDWLTVMTWRLVGGSGNTCFDPLTLTCVKVPKVHKYNVVIVISIRGAWQAIFPNTAKFSQHTNFASDEFLASLKSQKKNSQAFPYSSTALDASSYNDQIGDLISRLSMFYSFKTRQRPSCQTRSNGFLKSIKLR